jgi:hypothetical protein
MQSKLGNNVQIDKIWKLLKNFKAQCKKRNWVISKHEDWIKTNNGKYHNFVWTQSVHIIKLQFGVKILIV